MTWLLVGNGFSVGLCRRVWCRLFLVLREFGSSRGGLQCKIWNKCHLVGDQIKLQGLASRLPWWEVGETESYSTGGELELIRGETPGAWAVSTGIDHGWVLEVIFLYTYIKYTATVVWNNWNNNYVWSTLHIFLSLCSFLMFHFFQLVFSISGRIW